MKLIAIDLDGTLLSDKHIISEENKQAIFTAQKEGNIVVISSGRSLHDTREILRKAEINCPYITGNGAVSFESGKIIQNHKLSTELLEEIIPVLERNEIYYELYASDGIYFIPNGKQRLKDEVEICKKEVADFSVSDADEMFNIIFAQHGWKYLEEDQVLDYEEAGIYKIFSFSFIDQKFQQIRDIFEHREDMATTTSGKNKFEFANKAATKGTALVNMAKHFNIPIENTIAIGDNFNDVPMFQVAGIGVAMGNAEEEVKKQSNYVTLTNNEHGVAHAITKFVLNKSVKS